jgi:hypothetical protein
MRRRTAAIAVIDSKTLDIEHIYVNMTLKAAMRQFVADIKMNVDTAYDDIRDELADALERYQFVEVVNVTIGRKY